MNIKTHNNQHTYVEPQWHSQDALPHSLPAELYACLTLSSSLTQRLRELGKLQVTVIKEYVDGKDHWCREVVLYVNQTPAIIGHSSFITTVPDDTFLHYLKTIDDRPLGDIIFSELKGTREKLEFTQVQAKHYLFQVAKSYLHDNIKKLYARRSVVNVQQHKIIICEVFLPDFIEYSL